MRERIGGVLLGIGVLMQAGVSQAAPPDRPNILLIMSDDMGYSDIGCYGSEIATPNLDALAGDGVRFARFYNGARCCPTRASLMTGLYPHQAGMGHMTTRDGGYDGYRGVLNRQSVTIAEVLRPSGYRTYMTGKWHLTSSMGPNGDRATWPLGRGFEKYYGIIAGAANYFDPGTLTRGETFVSRAADPEYQPDSYYFTDAVADNAVQFLQQHQTESPDKPFFLYTAFTAAHWPMQAPEAAIASYKGKYDAGYEPIRAARFARMKELGLVPPETKLSDQAGDWDKVQDKAREARCQEVYAAMITTMDAGIGRMVAQLKASGQFENTLILFLQDNGGCAETVGRTNEQPDAPANLKPLAANELQPRTQPPMQTRDGRWVQTGPGVMPGPADTYIAYGKSWANVSNTPFREYKHWTHEGGISTPLIAHWPAGIKAARNGAIERQPGHLIDIMATCVDLAGATYPTEVAGKTIKPRQGVSLRPALNGEAIERGRPLFWEHEGNRAVLDGDWKLVAKEDQPWELYNVATDRSEVDNLAGEQSDRVKTLADAWAVWAARSDVLPLGAWEARKSAMTKKTEFHLKAGSHLDRAEAPPVGGRPFTIDARFQADDAEPAGVIVAQGGAALGYSLYVQASRPSFFVRTGDGTFAVTGPRLTPGAHTVKAELAPDGRLAILVDGQAVATPPTPGKLLARMPTDGLDVGRDDGGVVGPYTGSNAYKPAIESVTIEVGDQ